MRARAQLLLAAGIVAATAAVLHRIGVAKNVAAVGGWADRIDDDHPVERDAFRAALARVVEMGDPALAARLDALQRRGVMWSSGSLGPERWAVFVDTVPFVRRIYLRRDALLDPVAHLYHGRPRDVPPAWQEEAASLFLAGALRHELAHHDGVLEEAGAYAVEEAWYDARERAPWLAEAQGERRRAREWALASARLSAQKARARAAGPG